MFNGNYLFALQEDIGIETDEEYGAVIPNTWLCYFLPYNFLLTTGVKVAWVPEAFLV